MSGVSSFPHVQHATKAVDVAPFDMCPLGRTEPRRCREPDRRCASSPELPLDRVELLRRVHANARGAGWGFGPASFAGFRLMYSESELEASRDKYVDMAQAAREELRRGQTDTGSPHIEFPADA